MTESCWFVRPRRVGMEVSLRRKKVFASIHSIRFFAASGLDWNERLGKDHKEWCKLKSPHIIVGISISRFASSNFCTRGSRVFLAGVCAFQYLMLRDPAKN